MARETPGSVPDMRASAGWRRCGTLPGTDLREVVRDAIGIVKPRGHEARQRLAMWDRHQVVGPVEERDPEGGGGLPRPFEFRLVIAGEKALAGGGHDREGLEAGLEEGAGLLTGQGRGLQGVPADRQEVGIGRPRRPEFRGLSLQGPAGAQEGPEQAIITTKTVCSGLETIRSRPAPPGDWRP